MVSADETTELWRPPHNLFLFQVVADVHNEQTSKNAISSKKREQFKTKRLKTFESMKDERHSVRNLVRFLLPFNLRDPCLGDGSGKPNEWLALGI